MATKSKTDSIDSRHMRAALALASRGLGNVWPNPAVGCVIASLDTVIARGWTQPGGQPHAETEALNRAGDRAAGADAYITLEPCAHHGETPPCAESLVNAGIKRVFIPCRDPDPRVNGKGIEILKNANIEVVEGVENEFSRELNAGFFHRINDNRPLVTLKLATSLDGLIATQTGESKWITGAASRQRSLAMRASSDAIAVGSGTVLKDNPNLTCRIPGLENRSPIRVIFDGRLRTPLDSDIVKSTREFSTWIVTVENADNDRLEKIMHAGLEVIKVKSDQSGSPDLSLALGALAERGITRLLVEGGRYLNSAFLRGNLVDRLVWFRAPSLIGGDGTSAVDALGVESLANALKVSRMHTELIGDDLLETYNLR